MEVNKTSQSKLSTVDVREFKPVKGILIGLVITVWVVYIVTIIELIVFRLISSIVLSASDVELQLENNWLFLIMDLLICTVIVFFAGRSVGKRTPGKEIKYGFILTVMRRPALRSRLNCWI